MNNRSIAFITCVNNEELYEECVRYIDNLYIPDGYEVEKIAIKDAKSMASAYNDAIHKSNSKYKVYLHQDISIVNKNFILDFLRLFEKSEELGMIGLVGSKSIPTNGVWWEAQERKGKIYESSSGYMRLLDYDGIQNEKEYIEVQAIDGMLMITQHDLEWKQDIFDGWHFYDISQSVEFSLAGYKVVIPNQDKCWCVHNCGKSDFKNNYEKYRNKFLDNYSKYIFKLVTIIIPPADSIKSLFHSIDSVLKQTYKNIEVTVIGTKEEKSQLVEIFNDKRINFKLRIEKLSINENIDRILLNAKGEYFYVANHDNHMKQNKIEKMMNYQDCQQFAAILSGVEIEGDNNFAGNLSGQEACNYLMKNFEKVILHGSTAIINRKFYINQYGCFKNFRFSYISDLATLTNSLMYGNLLYIKEQLDEKSDIRSLDWQRNILRIQEFIVLLKYLKNKMIFKNSDELNELIYSIIKYSKRIIFNVADANIDEKKNLIECISNSAEAFSNKYDFNFKYIGDNVHILKDSNFIVPEGMTIEDNVSIFENATFMLPFGCGNIIIKKGSEIGRRIFVSATNSITIEDNVIIASNVHITDHNHEYKKIGIPIMKQGVTSFTNEVVIGAGSWIGNGCVIAGNVKIGRGCVIGANSVVLNDIPDYCVAVGSPAKVVKYFDRIKGEWIKLNNDEEQYEEYKKSLASSKPLLTIGIPTYNRSGYLEKCLENIYDQIGNDKIVEVLVVDNASTDATSLVIQKYQKKYSNFSYIRREKTITGNDNVTSIYELANGIFINSHGDDDYYSEGIIYKIIEVLYNNKDISTLFTLPKNCKTNISIGYGINDYLAKVSYVCTLVTGIIVKKSEIDAVFKKKVKDFPFNQVIFQLEILKNNKKFAILEDIIFTGDSGEHGPVEYNFSETFIKKYLSLIESYCDEGLTQETFYREKLSLLNNMIIPWIYKIVNENVDLEIGDVLDLYTQYYKEEPYFEEKLGIIKQIID